MNGVSWKEKVEDAIRDYGKGREALLPCLEAIQDSLGYISREAITYLRENLGIPSVEIYGVITFYGMLTTQEQGKYVIRIPNSLPCYLNGAQEIIDALEEELRIRCGETTSDKRFTLEAVSCLALCDKAPAMMINEEIYGNLTKERAKEIVSELRRQ